MAIITFEPAPDIVLENMTAQRKYVDGVFSATRVYANEGYVMYDTTDEIYETDPDTGKQILVTYYFTQVTFPAQFDFSNFTWVAVPRDSVDETISLAAAMTM